MRVAATNIDKLVIYRRSDDRDLVRLSSPATRIGANSSGSSLAVPIGFDFRFDGVTYTTIDAFAFGFLRLAGTETSASYTNLFAAANGDVLIAPWWGDLETADAGGYVKTETLGAAPWRRFVCEWYCNHKSGMTATDYSRAKFQVVLYETTDRMDFRFGTIETAGTPGALASASQGIKGSTLIVSTNWREFPVENRDLGGSNSTTTSLSPATQWPTYTVVAEPAWPMCGRLFLLDFDQLAGLQDPYAEPIWYIANAVNWLIARHCPPAVNIAPWQETLYLDVDNVVPFTPSPDGLTYIVRVETYTPAGGDIRISIDEADVVPQPLDDAQWSNLTVVDALATAAGWREWTTFEVTPSTSTKFLRITASHQGAGTIINGSVVMHPKLLDDIDESAVYASGAVPMCIAQIRQQGAAYHPEILNRAWRSIACVLRSRVQMLWSSIWPDSTKKVIAATTARPRRRIGISPAAIPGWRGQKVNVRCYAQSTLPGAKISVGELGGEAITVAVASTADYRHTEAELPLVSDEPVISCEATPVGDLSPMAVTVEWAPELGDADLILGVTPAPRLEYLVRLARRIEQALGAYAMTGLATVLCRGKSTTNATRVQWMIPPATSALRPKIARVAADTSHASDGSTIYGVSSGATLVDQVVLTSPLGAGRDDYPPEGPHAILAGSMVFEAVPAAAMDRLLESPTAASMAGPVLERLDVVRGVGMTLVPIKANAAAL